MGTGFLVPILDFRDYIKCWLFRSMASNKMDVLTTHIKRTQRYDWNWSGLTHNKHHTWDSITFRLLQLRGGCAWLTIKSKIEKGGPSINLVLNRHLGYMNAVELNIRLTNHTPLRWHPRRICFELNSGEWRNWASEKKNWKYEWSFHEASEWR